MPGFSGTGPQGGGPLTGRGRGFCIQPIQRGGSLSPFSRRPRCRTFNFPRFGFGRGFRGRGGYGYYQPQGVALSEKKYLEQQTEFLKEQLRMLEARLNDIKGSDDQ